MDSAEEISGEKILQLFDQIEREKTILRLHLLGKEFERLTIITGLEEKNDQSFFLIDTPEYLDSQISPGEECRVFFEFTDKKKIHYSFKTRLKEVIGDNTLIYLPQAVNRLQRRKNFRIITPIGTRLRFRAGDDAFESGVVNLSQNGVLIQETLKNKTGRNLSKGLILKDLDLTCPKNKGTVRFSVHRAIIRRIEKNIERDRIFYGLQFTEIDKKEEEGLKNFIYACQREELKKRSLDDTSRP